MRRLFVFILGICLAILPASALDFKKVDDMFMNNEQFNECQKILECMLPQASNSKEKAEVLWRLARVCVVKGQLETSKEGKKTVFGKGVDYAARAIEADPNNFQGYMWHCANVGRECQTKPLLEQAAAVPEMTKDLTFILDNLKLVKCAEAWQALAEIYYNHPFKSNDAAANFTRTAIAYIPAGEMRLSSYALLADILNTRGWSAGRRASAIKSDRSKFSEAANSNISKYTYFDGSLGTSHIPVWSTISLGEMSDKEEAAALVDYAIKLYNKATYRTETDKEDYKILCALKEKLK